MRVMLFILFVVSAVFVFGDGTSVAPTVRQAPAEKVEVGRERTTIAMRLLELEPAIGDRQMARARLGVIVERAVTRFGAKRVEENEIATARRFFRTVDEVLGEEGAVYPPSDPVDLLGNALTPRKPSDTEYKKIRSSASNMRRQHIIESNRKLDEPFYYFDCDVASAVYLAVAERLELPVYMVEIPGHNFVRWHSPTVKLNWDTNDGMAVPDGYYSGNAVRTSDESVLLGYFEDQSESRLTSYWLIRSAQWYEKAGQYEAAVKALRRAVEVEPKNYVAQGELAWALATIPNAKLRNGAEARRMSEKLVGLMRRRSWLETLAAACAETDDFDGAVRYQQEAFKWVAEHVTPLSTETRKYHQELIRAYEKHMTYAAAVAEKLVSAADETNHVRGR